MIAETVLPFKLGVTEEKITANGGLALFGEFLISMGLKEKVERIFPEPKSGRGFSAFEYIFALLLMIHSGGRHLEDIRKIREDEGLKKVLGIKRVPTSDALGDWLRRQGRKGEEFVKKINREIVSGYLKRENKKEYTLDIDATVIEGEKAEALKTYKGNKGYVPILGHLEENGLIISYEFREGNEPPSARNVEFYEKCKGEVPVGKRIKEFRGDSASYQKRLIEELERDEVRYAIGGRVDEAVKEAIKVIPKERYREYGNCKISETIHIMNGSETPFRLVVMKKAVQRSLFEEEEERFFVIASNREERAEETIEFYHQRGEHSENRIKEFKIDFGMERLPCGQFEANALYFGIGALAYNLYKIFLELALPSSFKRKRALTIRYILYNIAARVVTTSRQIYLKINSSFYELFEGIRIRIAALRT